MLMAGREQLWSSEPHPGLVPSGRSRVPCQLWVTWAGLKELGELEDRAGRLEPWARVTWGSAAGPEGTAGPFSKEPVGRRLCLCFAWTWASEELRRQGSLRCQVWSQLGEGRAGQVSPGWGWAGGLVCPWPRPWLPSCRCWCGKILPPQPTQWDLRRWAAPLSTPGLCGLLALPTLEAALPYPEGRACQPSLLQDFLPWCCPSLLTGVRPTGRGAPSWPSLGSQSLQPLQVRGLG